MAFKTTIVLLGFLLGAACSQKRIMIVTIKTKITIMTIITIINNNNNNKQ